LSSGIDHALIFDVLAGLGILIAGLGVFVVCSALARTLTRVNGTLDTIDSQLSAVSKPIVDTLRHVDGIADTADETVARLGGVVGKLEDVADGVGGTAKLASHALAPALVNAGAALTGVTAGLRRLVTGRPGPVASDGERAVTHV
jgi:uncharacterized protein YoxC